MNTFEVGKYYYIDNKIMLYVGKKYNQKSMFDEYSFKVIEQKDTSDQPTIKIPVIQGV